MLEVGTDAEGSLEASLVSMPIHAFVAPLVCHVIGMSTTEVGVAQSTCPAGSVLEPKEVMTAAAAAAVLVVEPLDELVDVGEVRVAGELVVGEVLVVAEDRVWDAVAGLLTDEEPLGAAGFGDA